MIVDRVLLLLMSQLFVRVKQIDYYVRGSIFKTFTLTVSNPSGKMLFERMKPENHLLESQEIFQIDAGTEKPEVIRIRLYQNSLFSQDTILGELNFPFKYIEPDFVVSDTYVMTSSIPGEQVRVTVDLHLNTKRSKPFTGQTIQWKRKYPQTDRRTNHRCTMPVQRVETSLVPHRPSFPNHRNLPNDYDLL